MKVGIIGGGIAGLSTAIALSADHDVTLFERAPTFGAVGAGIVISANAGRGLRSIGVSLDGVGRCVRESTVALANGRPLQRLDLTAQRPRLGPTVAISRPDLHGALVSALPASVTVRLGCTFESVDVSSSSLIVGGDRFDFDLVVGADGINSRLRHHLDDPGRIIATGNACWRVLSSVDVASEPIEYVGSGRRVGVVGLASGTYLYLVESAAPGELADVDSVDLRRRFAEFSAVRPLLHALDDGFRFDDLAELDRPIWGTPSTVLVGDAAHAMTPNLGQGASMAIEDAVVLARCLRDSGQSWFEAYVAERDPRVRWVQTTSRRLGRMLHVHSRLGRRGRNVVLRHAPAFVMRRQAERLLAGGPVPASGT